MDLLAKSACGLALAPADDLTASRSYNKLMIYTAAHLPSTNRSDNERAESVSMLHYDHFIFRPYKYRYRGFKVHQHNVVSVRLRLGNRSAWQVAEVDDVPQYSSCKLCNALVLTVEPLQTLFLIDSL